MIIETFSSSQSNHNNSQGFASGNLDEDGWALQHFLDQDNLELCIAQSFSKNFGLYSERLGALHVKTRSAETGARVQSMLEQILRSEMTTPPAFGARIVGRVLDEETLYSQWRKDLQSMSSRMHDMRRALHRELLQSEAPGNWDHILKQARSLYVNVYLSTSDCLIDRYVLLRWHHSRASHVLSRHVSHISATHRSNFYHRT